MSNARKQIIKAIQKATHSTSSGQVGVDVHLETPEIESHGDYSSNIVMQIFAKLKTKNLKLKTINQKMKTGKYDSPRKLAEDIVQKLKKDINLEKCVSKIEVVNPGFINFFLAKTVLFEELRTVFNEKGKYGGSNLLKDKKIMVEYAHPNTHKDMHIGHMRTLIVGEAIARLLDFSGATVFRANYQGDIGPHVAKAIWGTQRLFEKEKISWGEAEKKSSVEKAHLLGSGYVLANKAYKENKAEIDVLNKKIYTKEPEAYKLYKKTRKWSLDYYDEFYERFGTKFDRLYFESETAQAGKQIVLRNIGKVFEKSEGAMIFDGEKYGLHKRVFVTRDGNPTYEGKDMALAPLQYSEFNFDKIVHVVGSDQKAYFEVVIKALELLYDYLKGKQYHLPMGMVSLVGAKMSSRTGVIVRVDELLSDVKKLIVPLVKKGGFEKKEEEEIAEMITMGAVKYSVLKSGATSPVKFDIKQSVSLEGNSGPYLQYTYARTQSVLRKAKQSHSGDQRSIESQRDPIVSRLTRDSRMTLNDEEALLLRSFPHFSEVITTAAKNYSPNLLCNYLYDLAQKFNKFYNMHRIVDAKSGRVEEQESIREFRLTLTKATGTILKNGLRLLGIVYWIGSCNYRFAFDVYLLCQVS
jgi:arginyl-tRNA synthetase